MPRTFYKKLVYLSLLLALLPGLVSAAVSQVVFTTDPQTVKPEEISKNITIQLQDENGVSSAATETVDVEFVSTSSSGEFLSPSSGNPVTKTLSTGSANKNFRYRDSAEGVFDITINAKGRNSGLVWSVSQNIIISNLTATSTEEDDNQAPATTTNQIDNAVNAGGNANTTSNNSSNNSSSSVHYSARTLSTNKFLEDSLNLSAGRERIGSIGSPLEFKVESNLEYARNAQFKWNFGDGSEAVGEVVTHTYEYSGEYVVVLNATVTARGQAVARTKVRIVNPELMIGSANSDYIEVKNNSKSEVSLFGRALWALDRTFVFPIDTIIPAGQSIFFSSKVTGLYPQNPNETQILVLGSVEQPKINSLIEGKKLEKVAYLQNEILTLQQKVASLYRQNQKRDLGSPTMLPQDNLTEIEKESEMSLQTASAIGSVDKIEEAGWIQTLKKFLFRK